MRTIAAISAAVGFMVLSFAALQIAIALLDSGAGNLKLWFGAAVAGSIAAIAGTAAIRTKPSR